MEEQNKPKVTIGPDGTIHVDNKKPDTPSGSKNDQGDTIHASRGNVHIPNQTKTRGAVSYKTAEQIAREMGAADIASKQASSKPAAQPAQPNHQAANFFWGFVLTVGFIAVPFGLLTGTFPLAVFGAAAILISLHAAERHRNRG